MPKKHTERKRNLIVYFFCFVEMDKLNGEKENEMTNQNESI